jgi:hypothetical protein
MSVRAGTLGVFGGKLTLPPKFKIERTGTIDSDKGEISGPRRFVVHYDVGFMAGTHMSPEQGKTCLWYMEHTIGGAPAYTGVRTLHGRREIVTTIWTRDLTTEPANFWAEIRNEQDVATFMAIVSTYQLGKVRAPKQKK